MKFLNFSPSEITSGAFFRPFVVFKWHLNAFIWLLTGSIHQFSEVYSNLMQCKFDTSIAPNYSLLTSMHGSMSQTLLAMLIQNILWSLLRYQLWLNLYCIWINFTSLPLNILQLLVHQIIFWFETIMDLLAYHHIVYASWLHSWRLKCYLQVGVVEQQVVRKRARKSYSPPTDPNWSDQWSLVSSCLINKYMIFYMFSS